LAEITNAPPVAVDDHVPLASPETTQRLLLCEHPPVDYARLTSQKAAVATTPHVVAAIINRAAWPRERRRMAAIAASTIRPKARSNQLSGSGVSLVLGGPPLGPPSPTPDIVPFSEISPLDV
jgi:hypothetical protein